MIQELVKGDAESQAGKILALQHFRKANHEQRVEAVKHILGKVYSEVLDIGLYEVMVF